MSDIEHWDEIVQIIRAGRCVPFLGAGASARYEVAGHRFDGIPLAGEFQQFFNAKSGLNGEGPKDFILAAEELVYRQGRGALEEVFKDHIGKVKSPRPIHHALAAIPQMRFYFTTNYDLLMENALMTAGRVPEVHVHDQVQSNSGIFTTDIHNHRQIVVHKMHGTITKASTMIATQSDYIRYLAALSDPARGMPEVFRKSLLPNSNLLFLGYTLRDWDFQVVWEGVLEACRHACADKLPNDAYAIVRKGTFSSRERNMLQRKMVTIIEADLTQVALDLAEEFHLTLPESCLKPPVGVAPKGGDA